MINLDDLETEWIRLSVERTCYINGTYGDNLITYHVLDFGYDPEQDVYHKIFMEWLVRDSGR